MPSKKNPYINMTLEEVAHAEANFYYLQVADETAEYMGRQTFSKKRAEYLFFELMNSMQHMLQNGDKEDKAIAFAGLMNFKIHPLRIH